MNTFLLRKMLRAVVSGDRGREFIAILKIKVVPFNKMGPFPLLTLLPCDSRGLALMVQEDPSSPMSSQSTRLD